jgi:hypothetical protein
LLEETGALDVYFEDSIEILAADDPVQVETISEILTEKEIEFTAIIESSTL